MSENLLKEYNRMKFSKLFFSLLIDFIGMITYIIPVLGEFGDIVWAPISGICIFIMFGGFKGILGGFTGFVEEMMPGVDIVPTATLMWVYVYMLRNEKALSKFLKKKTKEQAIINEYSNQTTIDKKDSH